MWLSRKQHWPFCHESILHFNPDDPEVRHKQAICQEPHSHEPTLSEGVSTQAVPSHPLHLMMADRVKRETLKEEGIIGGITS